MIHDMVIWIALTVVGFMVGVGIAWATRSKASGCNGNCEYYRSWQVEQRKADEYRRQASHFVSMHYIRCHENAKLARRIGSQRLVIKQLKDELHAKKEEMTT